MLRRLSVCFVLVLITSALQCNLAWSQTTNVLNSIDSSCVRASSKVVNGEDCDIHILDMGGAASCPSSCNGMVGDYCDQAQKNELIILSQGASTQVDLYTEVGDLEEGTAVVANDVKACFRTHECRCYKKSGDQGTECRRETAYVIHQLYVYSLTTELCNEQGIM